MSDTMPDLIGDYERHLQRRRRSPKTIELYVRVLRRMDAELPDGLTTALADEIEDWIYASPRSDATCSLYTSIAQGFGKWGSDPRRPAGRRLSRNEAGMLDGVRVRRGLPRPVSEAALADILARVTEPLLTRIELAAFAGLRCAEIAWLDREFVDEREIRVLGKGSKWRTVPTHPVIWRRVEAMPAGPVAGNLDGSRPTAGQVSRDAARRLHKMGFGCSMHQFRHRFATQAYEACKDIRVVQELLGHGDLNTTLRYVGVNHDRQAAAVRGLPLAS